MFAKLLEFLNPAVKAVGGLISPFKIYIILSIILTLIGLSWTTYHYHKSWQEKVTEYKVLESKNDELILLIKINVEAVDKYTADANAREKAAKTALAASQKLVEFFSGKAQGILLASPVDKDLCKSTDFLFNQYIKDK